MTVAKKVILVDDIDGSETDVVTVNFALEGDLYEVDLSAVNLDGLREALKPFTSVARRRPTASARKKPTGAGGSGSNGASGGNGAKTVGFLSRDQRTAVREWARAQGLEVADRGAFPKEVLAAYQEAHGVDGRDDGVR